MTSSRKATEEKLTEIVETCRRSGGSSIIALAGVPGTGKSMMALRAAQRLASQLEMVREIQFHPSYSYEEFIEGMRIDNKGGVNVKPGIFLEWNQRALEDPDNSYVLLIEELTRANLSSVLGELMTYIENRDRSFTTVYKRRQVRVAENIILLATYNPTDRSAIEVDSALLRRLRIIPCPPSTEQLAEMLDGKLSQQVISAMQNIFNSCLAEFPDDYDQFMPFGHGIFAGVTNEHPDLHRLWIERIRYILRRPLIAPHKFTNIIEKHYPWKDDKFRISNEGAPESDASGGSVPE
jgi:5-methylcytosine-specific restriction protein B